MWYVAGRVVAHQFAFGLRIVKVQKSFPDKVASLLTTLSRSQKIAILLFVDAAVAPFAALVATWLMGGTLGWGLISVCALTGLLASFALGLPRIKLNSFEQMGIPRTAAYAAVVGGVSFAVDRLIFAEALGARYFLGLTMILVITAVAARLIMRRALVSAYRSRKSRQAVLIYGAGQTGEQLAVALGTDDAVEPVAFIDDNASLQKVYVAGLPVYSPKRIRDIIEKHAIEKVVLAMPSIGRPKQARIARHLESIGCTVVALPSFASLVGEGDLIGSARPVNLADYLGRSDLDNDLLGGSEIYEDRCVMITGAGGSIGSELARQVLRCRPRKLVLVDVSEHALYLIDRELADMGVDSIGCDIVPVLGSVTDAALMRQVFESHDVDTVLHAAAYKHVPLVERNRLSGLRNNVIGTSVLAKAAIGARVGTFILVSTDKAVQPKSVMGASKRFAELIVQDSATRSADTRFGIVRFGNVLGSSGSVVPLFQEQINRGGPVTLTHNDVTRYFMTISEAVRLVLMVGSQSHLRNEQGQVYVLDMGNPVSIRALACRMITASGYTVCDRNNPNGDIEIVITGLRSGEKLHEQLSTDTADMQPTAHPKIMRVEEGRLSELEVAAAMRSLTDALEAGDEDAAINTLDRWIGVPKADLAPVESTTRADATP